LGLLKVNPNV